MDRRTRMAGGERGLYQGIGKDRIPLWIPAANYYVLVIFSAGALFLAVLAVLPEEHGEAPWSLAGMSAVAFVGSLFLFREVVLRRFRGRALAARQLSDQLKTAAASGRQDEVPVRKITLQRNQEILYNIRTRSDAAKVLGKFADAHKEVFELCEEYLAISAAEISNARPGSPRIPALIRGSKFVESRHRYHMLTWAEIKARSFTNEAGSANNLTAKIAAASDALVAVDRATNVYPDAAALVDSRAVLRIFLVSARIKDSIEKAETADAGGSSRKAIDHYRKALSDLQDFDMEFLEREAFSERIQTEIGRISKLAGI